MHQADISAVSDLKNLKGLENVYALGALENLKGEIQIFNGDVLNTMVVEGSIAFDRTLDKKATLLVYADVKKWTSLLVPDSIDTKQDLEQFIASSASGIGIDTENPFPFLVEGHADSISWHVIDWKDGDTEHSHQKHIQSGLSGIIHDRDVEMIGFYSNSHHAVFTHHTTNMHVHFRTQDRLLAGHVDNVIPGNKMTLKLPLISK